MTDTTFPFQDFLIGVSVLPRSLRYTLRRAGWDLRGCTGSVKQSSDVAESKESPEDGVTGIAFVLAFELRDVVRTDRAREADVTIGSDRFSHVGRAVVMKCFREGFRGSPDITKMDVSDVFPQ